jgi:chromosome segregation ATPase
MYEWSETILTKYLHFHLIRLICQQEFRLGRENVQEIKDHPWFKGFDWSNIGSVQPPFIPELSGPDDTRYFEDEENESKKVARKPLPKTKEFSGQNLPFVGYTYVQNSTPSLVYPFMSIRKATSNLQLQASTEQDMDSALIKQLELDKQREAQRIIELERRVKDLELGKSRDSVQRTDLQASLLKLEKEKARLEGENRRLQVCYDNDVAEKEELQSRLSALKRKVDNENQLRARFDAIEEERDRLFRELEDLRSEGVKQRVSVTLREEENAEALRSKAALEKEVNMLNTKLQEERSLKADALAKIEALTKKAEREAAKISEIELERMQLEQKCKTQGSDISNLRKSLNAEIEKGDRLSMANMELERIKVVLEIDLNAAKRQVEESLADKQMFIAEKQKSSGEADVTALKAQIDALAKQKSKDASELSEASKRQAMLEIELTDLKERLFSESTARTAAQASFVDVQAKFEHSNEKCASLEDLRCRLEAQIKTNDATVESLKGEIEILRSQEFKILELEKKNAALLADLENIRSRLTSEMAARQSAESRNMDIERTLQDERRSRMKNESEVETGREQIDELRIEANQLRAKLTSLRDDQARINAEKTATIAKLNAEKIDLAEQLEVERRMKLTLDDTVDRLKLRIRDIEDQTRRDMEKITETEKMLMEATAQIQELDTHRSLEAARSVSLQDRIEELETTTATLQEQLDDARGRLTRSLDSLKADTKSVTSETKSERARIKLRNVFFRTQQQRAEQEKAMQRIHEVEEDMRRNPDLNGQRHSRDFSHASGSSFLSSQTKMSEPSMRKDVIW